MHIDCQTCPVRERMCGDCMVTHLFSLEPPSARPARPEGEHTPDLAEQAALDMFVTLGLVNHDDLAQARVEVRHAGLRSAG